MRYASWAFVFVNTLLKSDAKIRQLFEMMKNIFTTHHKKQQASAGKPDRGKMEYRTYAQIVNTYGERQMRISIPLQQITQNPFGRTVPWE